MSSWFMQEWTVEIYRPLHYTAQSKLAFKPTIVIIISKRKINIIILYLQY
jgi:hypothetical protein